MFLRRLLAIAIAFSLSGYPYPAALGVVSHADRAHIGEAAASSGTTVYDGDRLSTETGGALRLNLATTALDLAPQTSLTLHSSDTGESTQVELASGILVFSIQRAPSVTVHADDAWITPAGNAPTVGHIRVVSRKELRISAERGSLQFSYKGESERIAEGQAVRVILDPTDADRPGAFESDQDRQKPPAKRHKTFLFILIAIAGGVGIPFLIHTFESPDRP